jgi:hypothetical protein
MRQGIQMVLTSQIQVQKLVKDQKLISSKWYLCKVGQEGLDPSGSGTMEDEKTSHLLCKNRHAAFGLKRFIFLKRAFLEIFKASSKEGMITK